MAIPCDTEGPEGRGGKLLTQEVPRLAAALLAPLAAGGYGALALELPADETAQLEQWAHGVTLPPPSFTRPSGDGRANLQLLALVRRAVRDAGLALICFDRRRPPASWAERDRWMALELFAGWSSRCPRGKVLAICGNLHARLHNRPILPGLWPSCAAQLRALLPRRRVSSLEIQFRGGPSTTAAFAPSAAPGAQASRSSPALRPSARPSSSRTQHP